MAVPLDQTAGSPSTKSRLAVLQDRFSGFEKQLEAETKQRRETEESRLTTLKEGIAKLEKTLNAEIKRRVESNKAMQQLFESQLKAVEDQLRSVISERTDALHRSIEELGNRVTTVERDLTEEKEKYDSAVQQQNSTVAKDLADLKNVFESERSSRQEREAVFAKRIGDLEYNTEAQMDQDKSVREQHYHTLREALKDVKKDRLKGDEKFQNFVLEEMSALRNSMVVESQTRESADDEIVGALNSYTKALQDALRIVNQS